MNRLYGRGVQSIRRRRRDPDGRAQRWRAVEVEQIEQAVGVLIAIGQVLALPFTRGRNAVSMKARIDVWSAIACETCTGRRRRAGGWLVNSTDPRTGRARSNRAATRAAAARDRRTRRAR